jgi:adenylate cyclase
MAEGDHAPDEPVAPIAYRFDMQPEVLEVDDATRTITFRMVPDPRRYDRVDEEDRHGWFDRFDHLFIADEVMRQFSDQLDGIPVYHQRPEIESASDYVESRKEAIESKLEGDGDPPTFEDKSESFLATLEADAKPFVILSLDLQGSTRLSQSVAPVDYKTAITVILDELALVVSLFHGHVLKYTGDGVIAYFTPPSYNLKNDLALDCALTMRHLLYAAIFPALVARNFPSLEVRIGIDTGEAYVVAMGNPSTKQHRDIIGSVVSIAAKIQAQAPAGGILVGETVDRGLHVAWREQLREFNPSPTWAYKRPDGSPYRLLEMEGPGARAHVGSARSAEYDRGVNTESDEGSEP